MAKKSEIAKDKRVENIHMNQDILVDAINENLNDRMLYVLDGHFCLIKENGEISKVPEQTYRSRHFPLPVQGLNGILPIDPLYFVLKKLHA